MTRERDEKALKAIGVKWTGTNEQLGEALKLSPRQTCRVVADLRARGLVEVRLRRVRDPWGAFYTDRTILPLCQVPVHYRP